MSSQQEREYYRRRAAQERCAAAKADGMAAPLHAELAERYALLALDDAVERQDASTTGNVLA
uniref:hypothetical protein n=1 Tax=uncultured Sphingomonas sp. TaxID=158754 RepID=UPI0035CA1F9B